MAEHVRKQLRDGVRGRVNSLGGLGLTWYTNRQTPLDELTLPAATVFTDEEAGAIVDKQGTTHRRVSTVIVVVMDGALDELDDEADQVALSIETAFEKPPAPAARFDYVGTEFQPPEADEGDRWYAFLAIEYEAHLFTPRGHPAAPIT